jgi:hypothetical protein
MPRLADVEAVDFRGVVLIMDLLGDALSRLPVVATNAMELSLLH